MNLHKPPFWLAISGGILAFIAFNAAYDVPHRINLGAQAELAGRGLGDLRRPLRALEHAEIILESNHEHELTPFNDSVIELEASIERYRNAGLIQLFRVT